MPPRLPRGAAPRGAPLRGAALRGAEPRVEPPADGPRPAGLDGRLPERVAGLRGAPRVAPFTPPRAGLPAEVRGVLERGEPERGVLERGVLER
ncbi:MAG: hypothetical protein IT423_01005, partial [Pirellulaceae bacterium]|nr:hypothetical protein [Pirellulaceae bacterium]